MEPQEQHWLVRPNSIKMLWRVGILVLFGLVVADFFVAHHANFGPDGWPGFSAGFGFLACVGMVVAAKALGRVLKQPQDYYGE